MEMWQPLYQGKDIPVAKPVSFMGKDNDSDDDCNCNVLPNEDDDL